MITKLKHTSIGHPMNIFGYFAAAANSGHPVVCQRSLSKLLIVSRKRDQSSRFSRNFYETPFFLFFQLAWQPTVFEKALSELQFWSFVAAGSINLGLGSGSLSFIAFFSLLPVISVKRLVCFVFHGWRIANKHSNEKFRKLSLSRAFKIAVFASKFRSVSLHQVS